MKEQDEEEAEEDISNTAAVKSSRAAWSGWFAFIVVSDRQLNLNVNERTEVEQTRFRPRKNASFVASVCLLLLYQILLLYWGPRSWPTACRGAGALGCRIQSILNFEDEQGGPLNARWDSARCIVQSTCTSSPFGSPSPPHPLLIMSPSVRSAAMA